MTINLQWRDAMTKAGRQFTRAEKDAGWPQTMTPAQLAELQRPYVYGQREAKRESWALRDALMDACDAGAISHTTTTTRVQIHSDEDLFSPIPLATQEWLERDRFGSAGGRTGYNRPTEFKDVTLQHITAPAFAAWLAQQGLTPSVHVAAWFKAVDVPPVAPKPEAAETAEERQEKRYQFCLDRGLKFPSSHIGRMPKGIGEAAEALGIARQTLTDDLKAHIERMNDKCR